MWERYKVFKTLIPLSMMFLAIFFSSAEALGAWNDSEIVIYETAAPKTVFTEKTITCLNLEWHVKHLTETKRGGDGSVYERASTGSVSIRNISTNITVEIPDVQELIFDQYISLSSIGAFCNRIGSSQKSVSTLSISGQNRDARELTSTILTSENFIYEIKVDGELVSQGGK